MTSDARNSQMPSLPLASPVSGRSSTVYGIFTETLRSYALSGSNCGVKSFAAPGTLYSYGPRYTIGSVRKFPCPGGEGADHSSVVASHGLRSTALPHLMLMKKLTMKKTCESPSPHDAQPCVTFQCSTAALCAYCAPPSYIRRFIPASPSMNIGKNTRLMNTNDVQKCS